MQLINKALGELSKVILGKPRALKLAVCCLLAEGHLLIEDLPGMGKTTLAHALARVFGLDWQRTQFTSDMLPADILGVSVFHSQSQTFHFQPGPVFTQLLLADEINRATPKTQSALLEAMEERQVTVEGTSRDLPSPFFVVATQNPVTQTGTYPLPESQLDRFLMRLSLGYPNAKAERALLARGDSRARLDQIQPVVTAEQLQGLIRQAAAVHTSDDILDYVQRLLAQSRDMDNLVCGLSPRAGLGLLKVAKALASLAGRDYVTPDDIQAVFPTVCDHRLQQRSGIAGNGEVSRQLLESVSVVV